MVKKLADFQISEDALNLKNLLDRILETVISVFESYQVPLPTKRYWTVGEAAADCEQLVVTYLQSYLGRPGDEASAPRPCSDPKSAVVNISIFRSVPIGANGRPPTAESVQEGAAWAAVDSWVLLDSLDQFDTWDDIPTGIGVIATVATPPPSGAFQATTLTLTVGIP
jgi:hypothetical protein